MASDSDEDVPISVLLKRSQQQAQLNAAPTSTKKQTVETKKLPISKTEVASKKESKNNSYVPPVVHRMNVDNDFSEFYDNTQKGHILQTLLCRWWYAVSWPNKVNEPPVDSGYEPLDGYRGVYVCTKVLHMFKGMFW